MTAPNHVSGGIVFTGLFSSIWDINIFSDVYYLPFIIFASLLPDIDHTKSLIGKMFFPLARWLQRNHGHRTITHSLLMWIVLTLIVQLFDADNYTFLFCLAYFSHLMFDMMTVQGIPFLYPFLRNPYVIPGKSELRLKTGDLRGETIYFCLFLLSGIFFYPLMTNGFWTQYNRAFSTIQHVYSEYKKNDNLIIVDYSYRKEGKHFNGKGYVIQSSENECVLFNDKFVKLNNSDMVIEQVYPTPSDSVLSIESVFFYDVDLDSLNKLVSRPIYYYEIESTESVLFNRKKSNSFKGDFLNKLIVSELEIKVPDVAEQERKVFYKNPRINSLEKEINLLLDSDKLRKTNNLKLKSSIKSLKVEIEKASIVDKEILLFQLKDLESSYKEYIPTLSISSKKNQLNVLIELDNIKRKEISLFNNSIFKEVPITNPILYSGLLKFIDYENSITN